MEVWTLYLAHLSGGSKKREECDESRLDMGYQVVPPHHFIPTRDASNCACTICKCYSFVGRDVNRLSLSSQLHNLFVFWPLGRSRRRASARCCRIGAWRSHAYLVLGGLNATQIKRIKLRFGDLGGAFFFLFPGIFSCVIKIEFHTQTTCR